MVRQCLATLPGATWSGVAASGCGGKRFPDTRGLTGALAGKLILAGVANGKSLLAADPAAVAAASGIPAEKIRDWQAIFRKKEDIIRV
jgi:hypothetical protein